MLKRYFFIATSLFLSYAHAYTPWIYKTSFQTDDQPSPKFFTDKKALEKYLTSFGFLSQHFKLYQETDKQLIYSTLGAQFNGKINTDTYSFGSITKSSEKNIISTVLSNCNKISTSCKMTPINEWKIGKAFSGDNMIVMFRLYQEDFVDDKGKTEIYRQDMQRTTSWICKPKTPDTLYNKPLYYVQDDGGICYYNGDPKATYKTTVDKLSTSSCPDMAKDDICICNHYKDDYFSNRSQNNIYFASAPFHDEPTDTRGWDEIKPDTCFDFPSNHTLDYAISGDRRYEWSDKKGKLLCIDTDLSHDDWRNSVYYIGGCLGFDPTKTMQMVPFFSIKPGTTLILSPSNATPTGYSKLDNGSCNMAADPVSVSTGTLNETFIDYNNRSIYPLYLTRYYISSKPAHMSIFGGYWSSNFDAYANFDKANNLIYIYEPQGLMYEFQMYTDDSNDYLSVNNFNAKLSKDSSNNYKLVLPSGSAQTFNAAGELIMEQDPTGHTHHLAYENGHLTSISDQFHNTLTLGYGNNGLVSSLITPAKHTILYNYDKQNRLSSITYPDQSKETYLYQDQNDPNLLTSRINRDGVTVSTWKYNNDGQVISNIMAATTAHKTLKDFP